MFESMSIFTPPSLCYPLTDLLVARRVIERVHAKMLQFAIYGRAKATVLIREITGYLEGFNVQIDDCLVLFAGRPLLLVTPFLLVAPQSRM